MKTCQESYLKKNYQKNIPSTNMSQLSKLTTVYDIIIIRSFEGLELNNLKQNKNNTSCTLVVILQWQVII